ncbi:MAG: hypothetical protein MUF00_19400, partial [Gemmatimonadaceae bacterium]|nr:hypothetical protein [Gemmatimonadaceae bacterium]
MIASSVSTRERCTTGIAHATSTHPYRTQWCNSNASTSRAVVAGSSAANSSIIAALVAPHTSDTRTYAPSSSPISRAGWPSA